MKKLMLTAIVSLLSVSVFAQSYSEIWNDINQNKREDAMRILEEKHQKNTLTEDEYLTWVMLKSFNNEEQLVNDFQSRIERSKNPEALIYAWWFWAPVMGDYGVKNSRQLQLIDYVLNSPQFSGSLKAAAWYQKSFHFLRTNQMTKSTDCSRKMGGINSWQYVGPFDNTSGSGFDKNYGPISEVSDKVTFLSRRLAPIHWFSQPFTNPESWIFTENAISESTGSIVYAQSFVQSMQDQSVLINAGFAGNIKVWVNDQLVIRVSEEHKTELDAYSVPCKLNKGYNRILVQVGSDDDDPNFIIRITDSAHNPIPGLVISAEPQAYSKNTSAEIPSILSNPNEDCFIQKIQKDSDNLINYILLNRVYLRNRKVNEARNIIELAFRRAPESSVMKYELSLCYQKENNSTGLSEIYEGFKLKDPESLISYLLNINELEEQKKYQEALEMLDKRCAKYAVDKDAINTRIKLLAQLDKVQEVIPIVFEANKKYPDETDFATYIFNIYKNLEKNSNKAVSFLESFNRNYYFYSMEKLLIQEYFEQNNTEKALQLMEKKIKYFEYDPTYYMNLYEELMKLRRYDAAYALVGKMIQLKPFSGYFYKDKAAVEEAMDKKSDAIASYQKALLFMPTLYDARDKMLRLQNKKSVLDQLPYSKVDQIIADSKESFDADEYDYYYMQSEKNVVLYPEGGREEIYVYAIKILNQKGIDEYKHVSLSYNSRIEDLIILDAQLIKSNKRRTKPEINENQIVCTGLEIGDVIYVKYKKKVYSSGRFAKEFYDQFLFDNSIPMHNSMYRLCVPKDMKIQYSVENSPVANEQFNLENYTVYVWKKTSDTGFKNEADMPQEVDIGSTLNISTLADWNDLAHWYSDLVYSKIASDDEYTVNQVVRSLFDPAKKYSADEKAKLIYDYIISTINYSSISFRQSGLIPQNASKTITTKLGDCKDLSTLFVSLANKVGLKTNLVLMSTRNNGKKSVVLPSFFFNHCIVSYFDDKDKRCYLELTDRYIPFRSIPSNYFQAACLIIPAKNQNTEVSNLFSLEIKNKTLDIARNKTSISIHGNNLVVNSRSVKNGFLSEDYRSEYSNLSKTKSEEKMQQTLSRKFDNGAKLKSISFELINQNVDSVIVKTQFELNNQVNKIGDNNAFKLPFMDVIFNNTPFDPETRKYEFEYYSYENADMYETEMDIELPAGAIITSLPKPIVLNFKKLTYSFAATKMPNNHVRIIRKMQTDRSNISSSDYPEFRKFAMKVIEKEAEYITYK